MACVLQEGELVNGWLVKHCGVGVVGMAYAEAVRSKRYFDSMEGARVYALSIVERWGESEIQADTYAEFDQKLRLFVESVRKWEGAPLEVESDESEYVALSCPMQSVFIYPVTLNAVKRFEFVGNGHKAQGVNNATKR